MEDRKCWGKSEALMFEAPENQMATGQSNLQEFAVYLPARRDAFVTIATIPPVDRGKGEQNRWWKLQLPPPRN
ncbi:hypothetical protein Poly24_13530 [Rosistilla carotiformis]|uniref:Uncharacterized protein n=1 Tax=Rosistilla carotiformis TaxID=2528017 RepID=A0A518JQ36_9BACT|nr:hypothetical protein Poly24_13530 [Rosistilla carotiformis]